MYVHAVAFALLAQIPVSVLTSDRDSPTFGPHKVPLRFVPYARKGIDLAHEHFIDEADPRIVAGFLIHDNIKGYMVWDVDGSGEMYNYGLPDGPPRKMVINVPYASSPKKRKAVLLVSGPEEKVVVTLPYNPTKLPGRYRPVTVYQNGLKIYATTWVDSYGHVRVRINARSSRTTKFTGTYEAGDMSGPFETFATGFPDFMGRGAYGVLFKNDTIGVSGKMTELGVNHPRSFKYDIRFKPSPIR